MNATLARAAGPEPTLAPPSNNRSTRRQRRRRGPAVLEAEADRAADQILAGATGVATRLGSVAAANRYANTAPAEFGGVSGGARSSPGRALDAGTRRRLESGFGAGLGALRIHDDANAQRVVAGEGAAALAVGAHLYFGRGRYAPATESGYRLLLHETAHALQQTGRRGSDGRLLVTDIAADGPVQASDDFLDRFTALSPVETLDAITDAHGGPAPAITRRLTGGVDGDDEAYQQLVGEVETEPQVWSEPGVLSYLYDLMKAGRRWEAASTLLGGERSLFVATMAPSSEFETWLVDGKGLNWFGSVVGRHEGLRHARDLVYGALNSFLRRPDRSNYRVAAERFDEAVAAADGTANSLVSNERILGAGLLLEELEAGRVALCQASLRRPDAPPIDTSDMDLSQGGQLRAVRLLQLIPHFENWAQTFGVTIYQEAARSFRARAEIAREFWTRIGTELAAGNELRSQVTVGTDVGADAHDALRTDLSANRPAQSAAAEVAKAVRTALDAEEAAVPEPLDFRRRLDRLTTTIDRQTTRIRDLLNRHRLRSSEPSSVDLVPWLDVRFAVLRGLATAYQQSGDTSDHDDARQMARHKLAAEARRYAIEVGDARLERACVDVLTNRAGERSRLILVGDWELQPAARLGNLADDFPSIRLVADGVDLRLPTAAIIDFYHSRYLAKIADRLETDLEAGPAADDTMLISKAVGIANREVDMPQKWVIDEAAWQGNPSERQTVAQIVRSHPKTQALITAAGDDANVVVPGADLDGNTPTISLGQMLAWVLPDWSEFESAVGASSGGEDPVAAIAATFRAAKRSQQERLGVDRPVQVGPEQVRPEQVGPEQVGPEQVGPEQDRSEQERSEQDRGERPRGDPPQGPGLFRRATNHDRQVVAGRARRLLNEFAADDGSVTVWERPNQALEQIEQFTLYAQPTSERAAQTAALMIDIADALKNAFIRPALMGLTAIEETRYDVITGFFGFVQLADDWLDDDGRRAALSTGYLTLTTTELTTRSTAVKEVLASFVRTRERVQLGQGFESANGGLRSLNYPHVIEPGTEFGFLEARLTLGRLLLPEGAEFRFIPRYGFDGERNGIHRGGYAPARVVNPETGAEYPPDTELFEVTARSEDHTGDGAADGPTTVVTAGDLDYLAYLWLRIEERSFQQSMENLEQAIREAPGAMVNLTLDIAEFVPVGGQALFAARFVASVAQFLSSADFHDIKEALSGEAIERLQDLKELLTGDDVLDSMLMFVLFDADSSFIDSLKGQDQRRQRRSRSSRRKGRIGRLLGMVRGMATVFATEFEKMRDRVQPPLRTTQSFVLTHPMVALIVVSAARLLGLAESVDLADIADLADLDELGDTAVQGFNDRVTTMVDAVEGFELPAEIVPLGLAVDVVIGMLLDRLGTKGKIANIILEQTGAREEVADMIADALDLAELNPNDVWIDQMMPTVSGLLNGARNDVLSGIVRALNPVLERFEGIGIAPLSFTRRDLAVTTVDHPAAAEPSLAPHVDLADLLPGLPTSGDVMPSGPGKPLSIAARLNAAHHFGTDFGHVRLHRSHLPSGIDGLSRGSHVVVRPGLSLADGRGREVLRHELAHVAERGITAPSRGTPGPTVRIAPDSERRAQRHAAQMGGDGRHTGQPSDAEVDGDGDHAQPALGNALLERVLNRFADYRDLRSFQRDVNSGKGPLPTGSKHQQRMITRIHDALDAELKNPDLTIRGVPGGGEVRALVATQARNAATGITRATFERIAGRALVEQTPTGPKSKNRRGPRIYELKPNSLAALVEGYLLVRFGLQTDVDIKLKATTDPAVGLKVTGVFLGAIDRRSKLWAPIFAKQLQIGTTHYGTDLGAGNERASFKIKSTASQARFYRALRSEVQNHGPSRPSLQRGRFLIRHDVIQRTVDVLSATSELSPDGLPRPSQYLATSLSTGGGIHHGLRIGRHGQLRRLNSPARDSHHTTQFLFAEYFSHESKKTPFEKDEPGVERSGTRPIRVHRADGGTIQIGELRGGSSGERGDEMPAILISRHTHQTGRLHVGQQPPTDDKDSSPTRSQSDLVHRWYTERLGTPRKMTPDERHQHPSTIGQLAADSPARRRNERVVNGIEDVYKRMRHQMLGALKDGLLNNEKNFYEQLASKRKDSTTSDQPDELKSEWQLGDDALRKVAKAAEKNNDDVMAAHGVQRP